MESKSLWDAFQAGWAAYRTKNDHEWGPSPPKTVEAAYAQWQLTCALGHTVRVHGCASCRELRRLPQLQKRGAMTWRSPKTDLPRENAPIVMVGISGYIDPHSTAVFAGYYNSSYRPFSPWALYDNTSVEEFGFDVQWWCYLDEFNLPGVAQSAERAGQMMP